ncbi:MAG: radical SAM protein [Spirochaetales bacterium]|nr:radical SAM protein [Spirochaetales bacterium]
MPALSPYEHCRLCGRKCGARRTLGEKGFCGCDSRLKIAWAGIHYGEEPAICGEGGSGAVFLSGCTLKCFFCQNYQISGFPNSGEGLGRSVEIPEFADICLMLQQKGAENINIVTGTHFIPSLAEGIKESKKRGLRLPVVWNSSGYEQTDILPLLNDFVDIYLPDLKTLDSALSSSLFGVSDYPQTAAAAIREMAASRPLRRKENPRGEALVSGVIVRHLVLPGLKENTRAVLAWFAENLAGKALFSLMFQYNPPANGERRADIPAGEWARKITPREYEEALAMLEEFGIEDGFVQDLPDGADPLPDFSRKDAFPRDLAHPLWFCGGADPG